MPLGINTNLTSQGILKNLEASQAQFQKSVSRLSSGLRITTAADDPAGLIQAQKYQAQVNGLGQAISNARDAINLVQTAEGAMNQISAQLQSMRTLALHAANSGVNDSTAQAADQAQIRLALQSIDRIVSTTQFGNKKLLDGSVGVIGTATDGNASVTGTTSNTVAGTYSVQVTQSAVRGSAAGTVLHQTQIAGAGGAATDAASSTATLQIQTGSGPSSGTTNATAATVTLNIANMSLDQVVSAINNDSTLKGVVTASKSGNNLVVTSNQITTDTTVANDVKVTLTDAQADFGLDATKTNVTASNVTISNTNGGVVQAGSSAQLLQAETLHFSNGSTSSAKTVDVTLKAGTSLANAVSQANSALTAAGIGVTASLSSDGRFTLTNNEYGGGTNVTNSVSSTMKVGAGTTLGLVTAAGTASTDYTIADSANNANFSSQVAGADVVATINGDTTTGVGQILTGNTGNENGLSVRYAGAGANATTPANFSVTVADNSMSMQLGAFAGQTATIGITNMASSNLGTSATGTTVLTGSDIKLSNIDVTSGMSGSGAADALRIIDAAIAQVAQQRADLGAFQTQTLNATVSSSQVAQSNLTTTLSDIQDANMAQESTNFSRAQILQQQSISMLAQANQSGQLILKLFQ